MIIVIYVVIASIHNSDEGEKKVDATVREVA